MSKILTAFAFASLCVTPALALPGADEILSANKAATGGSAWDEKTTLKLEYAYSGQGLTGTTSSLEDLQRGAFVDSYAIPPNNGATGFDGAKAWENEPSGTVTDQAGGDVIPLAVTEAYVDRNLWWRADRGGAQVANSGQKTDNGMTFDVLTVTPQNGTAIDVWFDAKTHLLARTVEMQGSQTIKTMFSDYKAVDGVQVAHKQIVDDGSGNLQTYTLTHATFSDALPISAYTRPEEHLSDYAIADGAHEATAPFRLLNNHIYADVSVNGGKPMTFILDTGGHSILTPETAKALKVAAQGNMTSTGGGDAVATSGAATVQSLTVGAATITKQPVSVLRFSAEGVEGVNEAGMVGYEFFSRFVTRFDYGRHTVTFIDKKYFDPKDAGTPVPMRLYHQFPEVLGSYDGIPARFGIDTGSRMPLMLTKPFAAKNDIRGKVKSGADAQTGWGVGGASHGFVFRGGVLRLGDVTIEHPLTIINTDMGGSGAAEAFPNNIGGGVLKRFVVTFDYDRSIMYLKPVEGPVADLDTFDQSGMWINAVPEGFKVVELTRGGAAEAAGIQKGDILVTVDGKPAGEIALPAMRETLRTDKAGTIIAFGVKRSGATKALAVKLHPLF